MSENPKNLVFTIIHEKCDNSFSINYTIPQGFRLVGNPVGDQKWILKRENSDEAKVISPSEIFICPACKKRLLLDYKITNVANG